MRRSTLIGMLWGFYLGATLTGIGGLGFWDIRWWIICIPTIILAGWEKRVFNDENNY